MGFPGAVGPPPTPVFGALRPAALPTLNRPHFVIFDCAIGAGRQVAVRVDRVSCVSQGHRAGRIDPTYCAIFLQGDSCPAEVYGPLPEIVEALLGTGRVPRKPPGYIPYTEAEEDA
jgi:hypothetical protein